MHTLGEEEEARKKRRRKKNKTGTVKESSQERSEGERGEEDEEEESVWRVCSSGAAEEDDELQVGATNGARRRGSKGGKPNGKAKEILSQWSFDSESDHGDVFNMSGPLGSSILKKTVSFCSEAFQSNSSASQISAQTAQQLRHKSFDTLRRCNSMDSQTSERMSPPPPCLSSSPLARHVVGKQMSINSSNRMTVGVKLKVKLDFIDDVNQEVHTEVFVSLHFESPAAKKFVCGEDGFIALSPDQHPEIIVPMVEFLDFRSCEHIEGFRLLVNTMSGVVYVYRVYRVVFRSLLRLTRFPFDRQVINVELKSFTAVLVPWSRPAHDIPFGIRADALWKDHDVVVECDGSLWDLNWTQGIVHQDANPSLFVASFGLTRISKFYLLNFFLVTFLVVGSVFGCYAVDYKDFGTRSSITFTILLTIISIKFIMSSYTPKINYLTWLDYYNLLAMFVVIIVILENYMVSTSADGVKQFIRRFEIDAALLDVSVSLKLFWFWIVFHIVVLLGWMWGWFSESWERVLSHEEKLAISRTFGKVSPA